jgi:hypothetical protein
MTMATNASASTSVADDRTASKSRAARVGRQNQASLSFAARLEPARDRQLFGVRNDR